MSKPKLSGRLVFTALEDLQAPSSAFTVTTYIGALLGIHPYKISKTIVDILEGGLPYGFIVKHKNLYYIPKVSDIKKYYKEQMLNSEPKSLEKS